jgi:hypothetical protein
MQDDKILMRKIKNLEILDEINILALRVIKSI